MKTFIAALLTSSLAFADPPAPDAPTKDEETCASLVARGVADDPGKSVCLEPGQPAPFRLRGLGFGEHKRRERINARNADLWDGIVDGDVVVVSKAAFYALIGGGSAAVVALIVLGGLAFAHKL